MDMDPTFFEDLIKAAMRNKKLLRLVGAGLDPKNFIEIDGAEIVGYGINRDSAYLDVAKDGENNDDVPAERWEQVFINLDRVFVAFAINKD